MSLTAQQQDLMDRLGALHNRINQIADLEARAALVDGWAAHGGMMPEKERLIARAEEIVDQLFGTLDA